MAGTNGGRPPLAGRTALVTGAANGIGAAIAEAYAAAGARLGLTDRAVGEQLDGVVGRCSGYGVQVVGVRADVSVEADVAQMFAAVETELGPIDVLVNSAGILTESHVADMSAAMWDNMISINLRSVFLCSRRALPGMIERGFGRIISIASQQGQRGDLGLAHYSAAKAGVIGFTRSLAREVGTLGITANCIAPGPVETRMNASVQPERAERLRARLPLERFGRPDEVAPTAVLLASDPGGNLYTGQTLGPNCGDVML